MRSVKSDPLWLQSLCGTNNISLRISHSVNRYNRVMLSAGTCVESHDSYAPGSVVPIQKWRRLSKEEEKLISEERDPCRHVGVHAINPEIWRRLRVACATSSTTGNNRREMLVDLIEHLASTVAHFGNETHIVGFNRSIAERFTLTRDQRLPKMDKIGLHVDSWDGDGLDGRAGRTQRICINLGESFRYFLYVNLPVTEMRQNGCDCPKQTIARFFDQHPNYPVVALRVDPGECYIAPTELIVHDGWNPCAGVHDDTFTIRSRFRMLESSQDVA